MMKMRCFLAVLSGALSTLAFDVVGVANPGFENGREAWMFDGTNASVVDDVSRTGSRSACIVVKNAMKESLYIKRHIPVTGGGCYVAECFVKTEDVREDRCRQGSVGAGIIVEWLDAGRKWIGTAEYACGLWGTAEWRKVECRRLRAPVQASYAIVFLALRGAGRAWFDDFTFSQMPTSVEKVSPGPDSRFACNTPLFTWQESPGARSYSVVLSRSADFSREVRTYPADGLTSFRLLDKITPGTWYWKVVAPGRDDGAPWRFEQIAPFDADCLPPEVMAMAARVHSGSEPFEVVVRDDSFVGVKVVFEGQTAVAGDDAGKGCKRFVFSPPAQGWPIGLTVGEMQTEDIAGNCAKRRFYLLNAARPDNYVKLDGEGRYTVGGERFFPLSIYEVQPTYMTEVRAAGFDNVHLYRWEGGADDVSCRKYLDQCWAADGLRAIIGFNRGKVGKGLMQGNYDMVAKRVGALADHPGLFCWYLYDEPELLDQFISPARLRSYRELIHALDPYHPVVLSTWNNAMVGIRDYRPAWDVHWTQAYGPPDDMLKIIESQRRCLVEPSPMTLILGCTDGALAEKRRRGETPDPDAFARGYDLFRASAYLGIVKNFNGLAWWWYAKDRKDTYTAANSPKAWGDLVKVVKEIGALRPLLLAEGTVATGTVKSGKDCVAWWRKTVDGNNLFIAVNTADHPVSVDMNVPDMGRRTFEFRSYEVKVEGFEQKPIGAMSPVSTPIAPDALDVPGAVETVDPAPKKVTRRINLLENGDIGKFWYTWLKTHQKRNVDPDNVFTAEGSTLKVSGTDMGCVTTRDAYRDYKLTLEFRFVDNDIQLNKRTARDGGILFHSNGPDGAYGDGIWMYSFEYNVIQGASGDLIVVGNGDNRPDAPHFSCKGNVDSATRGLKSQHWDPNGPEIELKDWGRIRRCDIDLDWKGLMSQPLSPNENPIGEWNMAEIVCRGDNAVFFFNGKKVGEYRDLKPCAGRIQLQCEGFGIEYRNIVLEPTEADFRDK